MITCLAVPSRFRLVRAIAEADRCVGELAVSVGLSQSCTTRHLQALERAGLIRGRRDGKRVRFVLSPQAVEAERLLGLVLGGPGPRGGIEAGVPTGERARRRRGKPLPKGDFVGAVGRAPEGLDAAREDPGPTGDEAADVATGQVRIPRRQDIEDYLL
jgi:DNA-binding transcriptional ArsR family regulator